MKELHAPAAMAFVYKENPAITLPDVMVSWLLSSFLPVPLDVLFKQCISFPSVALAQFGCLTY